MDNEIEEEPLSRAESDRVARRRRGRNWAVLIVLAAIVVLFFAIAVAKLSGHPL